jgi:hypothetical protein
MLIAGGGLPPTSAPVVQKITITVKPYRGSVRRLTCPCEREAAIDFCQ